MTTPIAVVFDFDDTLAHDSTSGLLDSLGVDPVEFWTQRVQPRLHDGWDPIPAYLYELIEESKSRPDGDRITRDRLRDWGKRLKFFPGVTTIFNTLRGRVHDIDPDVDVEFYLISSGIRDVLTSTRIASQFRDIWACDFHCNERDEIAFPRNVISFTEKTRFLFQISKGLVGPEARNKHFEVNRRTHGGQFRIPLRRMIMVGDGMTDVPCFSLVKRYEGVPIGVYDPNQPDKWGKAWDFVKEARVMGLHQASYTKGSDLQNLLIMAVEHMAKEKLAVNS